MGGDFEPVPGGLIETDDLMSHDLIRTALIRELNEEIPPTGEEDLCRIKLLSLKKNKRYISADIKFFVELRKEWIGRYEISQKSRLPGDTVALREIS